MLRINRQTDYAVRVILALAEEKMGTRISTKEIGAAMLIPQNFLPRIVAKLAQFEIITTFAGRDGGLELSRIPEKITLRDVVEAFEGPLMLSECIPGDNFCPFEVACSVRPRWTRLQEVILEELASTNFLELAEETKAKRSHPSTILENKNA
ncbi:MAG: Rrf2 family transcriptional regulator [Anaerolineae bacterium]|jgi:Rrf2 family transcriptional regulator, iron-sulfur cluster assembly transcription factor|nr:Rrf2 family transcriptional regulator [Anaerolineae bacterium]MBT7074355.1 Rrf2 family transcriptional regulator [Anaerolineae bacterium]MBT7781509.1 Rrf2 family transcriptional regulator [Anaerolineae bacterium]